MRTVATLCRELTVDRRNDGELLTAFISHSSEEAFAELIRRHGPLVWGACRRLLPNPADAEDAFQAAFLVLVRRANGLTRTPTLGPWLHRVAVWTARNVRRKNARRFARQMELSEYVTDPAAPPNTDLKADLDSALLALPSRYRDSIILCHLQGFSRREAAERLGCAEGTLSGWLHRGLAKLRDRLPAFDPKVLSVVVAVPTVLAASTVHAATASIVAAATVPPAVNSLVEGVLHMFWVKKATAASVALFATFALGVGIGVGGRSDYSSATAGEGTGTGAVGEKAGPVSQPKETPPKRDFAEEIEGLELVIKIAEVERQFAIGGLEETEKKLKLVTKEQEPRPRDILEAKFAVARFRQSAVEAAVRIEELKEKLAVLKVAQEKGQLPPSDLATQIAELEREIKRLERIQEVRVEFANLATQYLKLEKSPKATEDALEVALTAARANEDISNKLQSAKAKLAKLKAEEKAAAPKQDERTLRLQVLQLQVELLQLKKQLSAAEVEATRTKKEFETAVEQLRAATASGNKELIAEASKKQDQARNAWSAAEAEYITLRKYVWRLEEKLKAMGEAEEAKAAKPQPVKTLPALNDLFGKPVELEEQLDVALRQASVARLVAEVLAAKLRVVENQGKPDQIQVAKAAAVKAEADMEIAKQRVEAIRDKSAAAKALATPPLKAVGACIEVVVVGGGEPWPCRVREYGREGKFLGAVIAEDGPALELVMTRAMKDGGGPRDLWLTVSPQQSPAAIRQAVEACKKAGYTRISINGTLPEGVEVPFKLK